MTLRRLFPLLATASVVAVPAFAETKTSETKGDQPVCKTEKVVGSNISRRVCMTRAEYEARMREAEEGMRDRDQNRRTPPPDENN